jgi:hypothetical protein
MNAYLTNTFVDIYAHSFNIQNICILPTQYIYICHMIPRIRGIVSENSIYQLVFIKGA